MSVDERGQLVLPKDLRVRAGIEAGARLAVVSYTDETGAICCITFVKASSVADAVKAVIAPAVAAATPSGVSTRASHPVPDRARNIPSTKKE